MQCPVCLTEFEFNDYMAFAEHLIENAKNSEANHVMWINRNLSNTKLSGFELSLKVEDFYRIDTELKQWIVTKFIKQFRGENPHPFILKMQAFNPSVLKGYAIEHYFFLRQWVKSCSFITGKTDYEDVQKYEIENIMSEFYGSCKKPPHIELLIEMGKSLGVSKEYTNSLKPLKSTEIAINRWNFMATNQEWIYTMAAMHSLELIANRDLKRYGAKYDYFNPVLLTDTDVPVAVKNFLLEGYESDISHSYLALDLIEKYSKGYNIEKIQDAYLASVYVFDKYLEARIQRGEIIENKQ